VEGLALGTGLSLWRFAWRCGWASGLDRGTCFLDFFSGIFFGFFVFKKITFLLFQRNFPDHF
jgi:hypothetical protein